MKSTGIVRKVDELGRIVIPRELCKSIDILNKAPLEFYTDRDYIILKKHEPNRACNITGEIIDHINGTPIVLALSFYNDEFETKISIF
ncbi:MULTISPECIES: AbrB/MazE/SpoVT family DNA-binding domain-containing protein [Bacillus]|uniref:AbrB/MazE/SpoVT family DNA-binding domain-containing protein n=1 Tax=Bacillus TaxID=1386 RepID=UPI000BEB6672|nr:MULTISPECIES: AbrB/MazE/SpoVT family DNA-binding domain-containing protein [Bacillus cereus group]PDZ91009.1 transition state regulator Abh [Bacillus thuringiensis]MCH5471472.1 AbrB/MazE/SpoVT family DNA-binding domain-containing protein [Bacillus toyonensis]PEB26740.1 transition state regulator Abh [Bacillus toyonensis]PED76849.1 transition state regulator Abh [Bacillus toyonensis]UFI00680.1 AbrB/MazE/SpoVT family DNA-binding domain-containing protein [Bacillus toyonensis]